MIEMKLALIATIVLAATIHLPPGSEAQQRPSRIGQDAQTKSRPSGQQPAGQNNGACSATETQTTSSQPLHGDESPQWALVFVGIATCLFIGWQSWETRRAAEANRTNAEVLWASQRAQLVVGARGDATEDLMSAEPKVRMVLSNKGMTPAYDVSYETWIEVVTSLAGDFTPNAEYMRTPHKISVYSHDEPIGFDIPLSKALTKAQLADLMALRSYVCFRVRAEYRDARFPGRYVDFGFCVTKQGLLFLSKYHNSN